MRLKAFTLACFIGCLAIAVSASGQGDPLTGTWSGDWGPSPGDRNPVTVELKWDGKVLMGTVNPGPNAVKLEKTSFDAKTSAVRMEAQVVSRGRTIHYVIDGKVEKNTMTGSWTHDNRKGDFRITKK
jgi:hypothetical protein